MLIERIIERKKEKIRLWPSHTNRASEFGHPCIRYLVFKRTRWQEAQPHDVRLQMIFDEGHLQEQAVLRDLQDAGWQIIEQQRDYHWEKYQITAHLDGKLLHLDHSYPLEIKSMSPFVFQAVNSYEDLKENKRYPHLRRYPAQMQLYLLLSDSEEGVLLLKNKATGELKELWVKLDMAFAEELVLKAETVNQYVERGETPPPIQWDEKLCGSCPFGHICLPEAKRDALEITDDPEIEAKLDRRAELDTAASEYDAIDKELKRLFRDKEKIVVGQWLVTGRLIEPKGKPPYWKCKFDKLATSEQKEPV